MLINSPGWRFFRRAEAACKPDRLDLLENGADPPLPIERWHRSGRGAGSGSAGYRAC